MIALVSHPPLAQAQTVYFDATPAWVSDLASDTYSAAAGDVDLDGDLDVVFGNKNQPNTLYLNLGRALDTAPPWQSGPAVDTRAVALGDIDGDGDLDLICGNWGQPNVMYRNVGGPLVFETQPAWTAGEIRTLTNDVVLADVDNDGDLDLVCANGWPTRFQENTVYLNNDGTLETMPAWRSGEAWDSRAVAAGDMDGDGDLDIVFGNAGETPRQANTMYRNLGGSSLFEFLPAWRSSELRPTMDVALGDIDGDGDLDLLCANGRFVASANTMYENRGLQPDTLPAWYSSEKEQSTAVAIGDVEGDGDLDVLFGGFLRVNRLYLSEAGQLATGSAWESDASAPPRTMTLIVADMDGDGDLDQVAGVSGAASNVPVNPIYTNQTPPWGPLPDWVSTDILAARDMDFADVNGDEYDDLVIGKDGNSGGIAVHYGRRGGLDTSPTWVARNANAAEGRMLVIDADNDEDPDLLRMVATTSPDPSIPPAWYRLHLNDGNAFDMSTVVDSFTTGKRAGFAADLLGSDGYGDDRLDVVLWGSIQGSAPNVHVYQNSPNDFFSSTPSWSTSFPDANISAGSVTLGDIDQDGRFDLVVGGHYGLAGPYGSMVYRNSGETFELLWQSTDQDETRGVTVGDVNGDGWPDVLCGNADNVKLYWNRSGSLDRTPGWEVPSGRNEVRLVDVDADGDLDGVTSAGSSALGTLLRNNGGQLEIDQSWSYPFTTGAMKVRDIDRDGDLDVIYGTAGGELYYGRKQPAYKSNTLTPTRHLPNNAPFVRDVDVAGSGDNAQRITLTVFDVESDPVWLLPDYQFEGAPKWFPVVVPGHPEPIGPLASSPAGVPHTFDWDIFEMPFDRRDIVLRLRVVSTPRRVSHVGHVGTYMKPVGQLAPLRPEISVQAASIQFPTVTVGDTTCATFTVSNTGTSTLNVHDITVQDSTSITVMDRTFELAPGQQRIVDVCLAPCEGGNVRDGIRIASSDPLTPEMFVQVETDIRALSFDTDVVSTTDTLALGEAVSVIVTPGSQVAIERGFLLYRPRGREVFSDSLPLIWRQTEGTWIAVVPGEDIAEMGFEYYIRAENDCAVTTDPPDAPDSVHSRPVEAPEAIATRPIPNAQSLFLAGQGIRVDVELPAGARFASGSIHYRQGGTREYETGGVTEEGDFRFAVIPASAVGPRGVDYWVEVQTQTTHLTDPLVSPAASPRTIRSTVPSLVEETIWPGTGDEGKRNRYHVVSIPLDFGAQFDGTLESILSDQPEFGPYSPFKWRAFGYDANASGGGRYIELSPGETDSIHRLRPGRAWWLAAREDHRIDTSPVMGTSTRTDRAYAVRLEPGWNLVGHPFAFPVAWDTVTVDRVPFADAVDSVWVEWPVEWVVGAGYAPERPVALDNFGGYWVHNLRSLPVTLRIPPIEHVVPAAPAAVPRTLTIARSRAPDGTPQTSQDNASPQDQHGWTLHILVAHDDAMDTGNAFGVRGEAKDQRDPLDRSEPPPAPGRFLSLYAVNDDWALHAGRYTADIRGDYLQLPAEAQRVLARDGAWGQVWHLDLIKTYTDDAVGDEVTISVNGIGEVPAEASVYLVDRHLGNVVDLRGETAYRFLEAKRAGVGDRADARFLLIVGSEAFAEENDLPALPAETSLYQNYPNPFNPSTVIRYELAEPGEVTLRIYDVTGALVRELYRGDRPAGRYETVWRGDNQAGNLVSSGIYFSRLSTPRATRTRKMVMIK